MLFLLSVIQALLLAAGQLLLKVALARLGDWAWTWESVARLATNGWLAACGVAFTGAGLLWAYILRHYPFSVAYPLSSMAYVFGLLSAWVFLDERPSFSVVAGVVLIMAGCWLVAR